MIFDRPVNDRLRLGAIGREIDVLAVEQIAFYLRVAALSIRSIPSGDTFSLALIRSAMLLIVVRCAALMSAAAAFVHREAGRNDPVGREISDVDDQMRIVVVELVILR